MNNYNQYRELIPALDELNSKWRRSVHSLPSKRRAYEKALEQNEDDQTVTKLRADYESCEKSIDDNKTNLDNFCREHCPELLDAPFYLNEDNVKELIDLAENEGCSIEDAIKKREHICELEAAHNHEVYAASERLKNDLSHQKSGRILEKIIARRMDFYSLRDLSDLIALDLRTKLSSTFNATIPTVQELYQLKDELTKAGMYNLPLILISTELEYDEIYRQYETVNQDGNRIKHFINTDALQCLITPRFDIFANSNDELESIINEIKKIYSPNKNTYYDLPDIKNAKESFQIDVIIENEATVEQDSHFVHGTILSENSLYVIQPKEDTVIPKDKEIGTCRYLQLGYYYHKVFDTVYFGLGNDLAKYENLFKSAPENNPLNNNDDFYRQIIECIQHNNPITDISAVWNAFPRLTLLLPELAVYINNHTDIDTLSNEINLRLNDYLDNFKDVCKHYGLQKIIDVDDYEHNHRQVKKCFTFILSELDDDILKSVKDIIYDYAPPKNDHIELNIPTPQYVDAGYDDYDDQYSYSNSSGGEGGFLRGVLSTAIGASIANHGVKKELRKLREEEAKRLRYEKDRDAERARKEWMARSEAARKSQYEWNEVHRLNQERRRKGLPELPYPHRFYS